MVCMCWISSFVLLFFFFLFNNLIFTVRFRSTNDRMCMVDVFFFKFSFSTAQYLVFHCRQVSYKFNKIENNHRRSREDTPNSWAQNSLEQFPHSIRQYIQIWCLANKLFIVSLLYSLTYYLSFSQSHAHVRNTDTIWNLCLNTKYLWSLYTFA